MEISKSTDEFRERTRSLAELIVKAELPNQRGIIKQLKDGQTSVMQHQIVIYKRMEMLLASAPSADGKSGIACQKGCSYCCHDRVFVSAAEAMALADFVEASPEAIKNGFKSKLLENARVAGSITVAERMSMTMACAFLGEDNSCVAYAVRPSACRNHHSVDVSPCKKNFENPKSPQMQMVSVNRKGLGEGFMAATCIAMSESGFDTTLYEMNAAVVDAGTNSASIKRWRKGKVAFPTVKDRANVMDGA